MLNFTPLARRFFLSRLRDHVRYIHHADAVQQEQLVKLIEKASLTEWGRKYDYSTLRTYRQWSQRVPLTRYDDVRDLVMRMIRGEAGVLWPGKTYNFAQSSGTSGKSKYIPITADSFRLNHYQGASDAVSHYLNLNSESRIFAGKALILGGSFGNELRDLPRGVRVGDLSASLIDNMNPLVAKFRVPTKDIALMEQWDKKLPALVEASIGEDITNLSGVPSWFLTVIKHVLQRTGASCIHEVWPNLEVFFHGGIAFDPYRAQYEQLCDMSRMHLLDTYNASEGFFAVQSDWDTTAMLLLLDVGVFYEFIPQGQWADDDATALPIWEIEAGKTYELVITACNGLCRYRIGDTVTVEQLNPVKIKIAGRTRSFINAFGEELMEHNAEQAMAQAQQETELRVLNYTVAPVFATATTRGCHQWLIEFDQPPADTEPFMHSLDKALRSLNSDYDAKRTGDIFMAPPMITVAPTGIFERWLAATGKLGGQRKVLRLSNNRDLIDAVLKLKDQDS